MGYVFFFYKKLNKFSFNFYIYKSTQLYINLHGQSIIIMKIFCNVWTMSNFVLYTNNMSEN
jgi:hypothetical protein